MMCPHCKTEQDIMNDFCGQCGKALFTRQCSKCKRHSGATDKFCIRCGTKLEDKT